MLSLYLSILYACKLILLFYSEGENEVWYYSTKGQIEELFEVLDPSVWERELCFILSDLRDDIVRQMNITEALTKEKCSNKKSAIEIENGMFLVLKCS